MDQPETQTINNLTWFQFESFKLVIILKFDRKNNRLKLESWKIEIRHNLIVWILFVNKLKIIKLLIIGEI